MTYSATCRATLTSKRKFCIFVNPEGEGNYRPLEDFDTKTEAIEGIADYRRIGKDHTFVIGERVEAKGGHTGYVILTPAEEEA